MPTIVIVLVLCTSIARADDWPAAHPQGWHAQGFGQVAEMFPPKSRHNAGDKPIVYVYDVTSGAGWATSAKLVWKGPLPNREAPYEAILVDGYLVTFDDWASLGGSHAVVIFDPKGKQIATKKLDDMLPAAVADRDRSISSRYWRRNAKYQFDISVGLLRIALSGGEVLEITLASGKHKLYAKGTTPPPFKRGQETGVWPLNLRFSSITDVLAAGAKPQTGKAVKPNPYAP